jgi:hypothetical protein
LPALHALIIVHGSPSSQVVGGNWGTFAYLQPTTVSHESVVQPLLSLHVTFCTRHWPLAHWPDVVQALPSSQGVPLGADWSWHWPVAARQTGVMQVLAPGTQVTMVLGSSLHCPT